MSSGVYSILCCFLIFASYVRFLACIAQPLISKYGAKTVINFDHWCGRTSRVSAFNHGNWVLCADICASIHKRCNNVGRKSRTRHAGCEIDHRITVSSRKALTGQPQWDHALISTRGMRCLRDDQVSTVRPMEQKGRSGAQPIPQRALFSVGAEHPENQPASPFARTYQPNN